MSTHTTFALRDRWRRAEAIATLEAEGYRCIPSERGDLYLVSVIHSAAERAIVRAKILHVDATATRRPG